MEQVQVVQGEIRKTEDGRTVLVLRIGERTLAFPVELDEAGKPKPIGGCWSEETVEPDGTPHLWLHTPCLSVANQPHRPTVGGLTLLEGSGTDG
jgi:hypothetical protein